MYAVQSLETMGGLEQVNGNVALTLEKLPGIRGDLTRTDPDWESLDFVKLVEALHRWTRRNPIEPSNETRTRDREYRRPLPPGNYIKHGIKISCVGACIAKIKIINLVNAQR